MLCLLHLLHDVACGLKLLKHHNVVHADLVCSYHVSMLLLSVLCLCGYSSSPCSTVASAPP